MTGSASKRAAAQLGHGKPSDDDKKPAQTRRGDERARLRELVTKEGELSDREEAELVGLSQKRRDGTLSAGRARHIERRRIGDDRDGMGSMRKATASEDAAAIIQANGY